MQNETLIVEDVLLLMLDDATGAPSGAGTIHRTLGMAVLTELALLGRIIHKTERTAHHGTMVVTTGEGPLPDPLLQQTYDSIAGRPRHIEMLLDVIGFTLSTTVAKRLLQRGLLRRKHTRFLGPSATTSLLATDKGHEPALRERMRAALEDGVRPSARLAAVIAVISASGTLMILNPVPRWSTRVASRAKAIERSNWIAVGSNVHPGLWR